jgi:rRNA maturation protein Nop10
MSNKFECVLGIHDYQFVDSQFYTVSKKCVNCGRRGYSISPRGTRYDLYYDSQGKLIHYRYDKRTLWKHHTGYWVTRKPKNWEYNDQLVL